MRYLLIFIVLLSIAGTSHSQTSNDANWDSRFCPCGVTFPITCIVKDDEKLYLGGKRPGNDICQAQGKNINLPVVWDGKEWTSLGGGVSGNAEYVINIGDTVLVIGSLETSSEKRFDQARFWDKKRQEWYDIPPVYCNMWIPPVADSKEVYIVGCLVEDVMSNDYTYKILRYNYNEGKWRALPMSIIKDFVISPEENSVPYVLGLNEKNLFVSTSYQGKNWSTKLPTMLKWDRISEEWGFLGSIRIVNYSGSNSDTISVIPHRINSLVPGNGDTVYAAFEVDTHYDEESDVVGFWDGKEWKSFSQHIRCIPLDDKNHFGKASLQMDNGILYLSNTLAAKFIVNNKDTINNFAAWDGSQFSAKFSEIRTGYYTNRDARFIDGNLYYIDNGFSSNPQEPYEINGTRWNGKNWVSIDSGTCFGINGWVFSSTISNDTLYACGYFTRAGGVVTPGLAFWDGNNWNAMGDVYDNVQQPSFEVLRMYKNKLYGAAFGLMVWENNKWNPLPITDSLHFISNVRSLEIINDTLYVGGHQNSKNSPMLAKWDGEKWSEFSSTSCVDTTDIGNPYISGITTDGTSIYITGHFTRIGSDTMNSISKWNGKEWKPIVSNGIVGLGSNNRAGTIVYDSINTRLIITAYFDDILGIAANGIAAWNGEEFTSLFKPKVLIGDMSEYGSSMVLIGSNLVLSPANPKNPNIPIKLDSNKATTRFGTGVGVVYYDQSINSMQTDSKGNLYVLGIFNEAGEKPSANIAMWKNTPTTSIHIKDAQENSSSAFPNPASGFVKFTTESTIESITITDALGKEVERKQGSGQNTFLLDLANYTSGVYNAALLTTSSKQNVRFVVMK